MRKPTLSERKRAEYLLECIATADDRAIRRKLGIPDKGFKKRLVHNLTKYCTIADAPRSGRPRPLGQLEWRAGRAPPSRHAALNAALE